MRLIRQIRITEISSQKQGCFLKVLGFPVTIVIDVDRFAKLYFSVYSDAFFRSSAEEKLEGNFLLFREAFSSEYDCKFVEERMGEFPGNVFYTCKYSDNLLKPFVDTLLLNGIRVRIALTLVPKNIGWLLSFAIASDREIGHIISSILSDMKGISRKEFNKALSGDLIAPMLLKKLTIPRLSGIDETPSLVMEVPSKYTFADNNSIQIGKIIHPANKSELIDAFLPIQRINQHVGILATTGAGKTNLCHQIILQLHEKGIPCLIFDWKRDYRDLHKKINAKVYDFTGNNLFTFNPVKPSGNPSQWVKEVANIMAEVASGEVFASGAFSVYVELLDNLYKDNGVYSGSANYPTVFDLLTELEERSQRQGLSEKQKNWIASASKLFKSLSVGITKEAFDVKEGLNLDDLLNNTVIIELDGLGDPKTKAFFISVLLQKIRNYRLQKADRDVLKHVIIIEEAQNVLAKDREASSIVTTTYREIRSLCEGIICITQMPSELSKDALANTNTFFVLKLIHRDDKLTACNLLGFNPSDMKVIEDLDTGTALMKADDICLVKVPLIQKDIVNDSELRIEKPKREDVSTNFAARKDVENRAVDLSAKEWLVLKHIAESTAYNYTTFREIIKYSYKEFDSMMGALIMDKGFVRYREAKKKGVGGRKQKIYFLFPYGEEAYKRKFGKNPDRARVELVGKHDHEEMKNNIIRAIGKEIKPPDRFDILLADDTAIEIETGTNQNEQIYKNIEKSVRQFGKANFIASEQRIYFAIIQLAAKYSFDKNEHFILSIALYDEFLQTKEWSALEF